MALDDPRWRDPCLEALKIEISPSIFMDLIKAVSVFPEEKVLEAFLELLTHRDEYVRATAAIALEKMGQPRAIPALQHMALTDTNYEVFILGLVIRNSSVAQQTIHMILHPEQEHILDWPG